MGSEDGMAARLAGTPQRKAADEIHSLCGESRDDQEGPVELGTLRSGSLSVAAG